MTALDDEVANETRPAGIGPGDRLQAARIQRGLSLEDVAERMHLSPNILEALEENNFEEITAPIFVKGYLRAYARIVALDEDEMIQQYMDYYSEEDPPITSTSNMAPELSVADARIKWTTYLVILVLVALLGAWWWNKESADEPTISLDSQPAESEAPAAEEAAIEAVSESNLEQAETVIAESTMEDDAVAEVETAQAEPVIVEPEPEPEVEIEPAAPEPEVEIEPAAPEPEIVQADTASDTQPLTETAAVDSGPTLIAPTGSDRLQIIVYADTWADVKDSTGYQMVYDLLRADQDLELTGAAPFSVFLGNGHGVEIRINDEDFSFSNRIRDDNTARLKIGG